MVNFRKICNSIKRRKPFTGDHLATELNRCLTAFDLTLFGIGNMSGSGIYVLTGTVMRDKSGPAAFISYMLAGLAAFLNALCYAELGSRIPKAGSAYIYTYIAGGELLAFIIGWSVLLEYVLSVASVARGWSGTIDALTNNAISNATIHSIGSFTIDGQPGYPDFISVGIIILLGVVIAAGPRLSVNFNTTITMCNMGVIFVTSVIMLCYSSSGTHHYAAGDHGGFMPFGLAGVVAGAGTSFYSFIGFDAITISSEEAVNPKRAIPIATGISVVTVTSLFILISAILPAFVPWWTVDRLAVFPAAMKARGLHWAAYVTGIGSMLGISASLFTSYYAMPRVVYAMAQDGLLPPFLGYVFPVSQVPVVALIVFGSIAAILAFVFSISILADFLSIGTLIAYSIVCGNLIVLRYRRPEHLPSLEPSVASNSADNEKTSAEHAAWMETVGCLKPSFTEVPVVNKMSQGTAPVVFVGVMTVFSSCLWALVFVGGKYMRTWWAITLVVLFSLGIIISICVIGMHNQNTRFDSFKVPFVPLVPCLCIMLNLVLIVNLPAITWVRFFIWLLLGLLIYFFYGINHSTLNVSDSLIENTTRFGYQTLDSPADNKASQQPFTEDKEDAKLDDNEAPPYQNPQLT